MTNRYNRADTGELCVVGKDKLIQQHIYITAKLIRDDM